MPRNSQGLYTLPSGNPVVPNTLIESDWANTTMDDIAVALTGSLPRNGSAPMTGPLTLANSSPVAAREAASKGYVDNFLAYSTGMPVGAIVAFGGASVPSGYLVCDGAAISRTGNAVLFGAIGTIYGVGDGATTFNLPDLRDQFIRGKADSRALGSTQPSSIAAHKHALNDPGHNHATFDPTHSHNVSHTHGINDPGHNHDGGVQAVLTAQAGVSAAVDSGSVKTGVSATGVTVQSANPAASNSSTGFLLYQNATGLTMANFGGDDTYPQNMALVYVIKAANDSVASPYLTTVASSDENCIAIDGSTPGTALLDIQTNVPFGLAKLDASGSISPAQLGYAPTNLLGTFDADPGLNPSEAFPSVTFATGDWYIVSNPGTITVYDPDTDTTAPHLANEGDQLLWIQDSPTGPTGWYWLPPSVVTQAINVGFTPVGGITATDVQAMGQQLDTLKAPVTTTVTRTGATGAAIVPAGDTSQRPAASNGMFRYNSETGNFEGYANGNWAAIGIPTPISYAQGFKNKVINGGLQVWQRGTTFSATGWTADRWYMTLNSGTATFDRRTKGNALAWDFCRGDYVARLTASAVDGVLQTYLENVTTFANQTVVLSYKTNNLAGNTGAAPFLVQNFGTGGSPAASVNISAASVTTVPLGGGFFRKEVVFNVPSVASKGVGTNGNDYLTVSIPFAGTFTAYFMFDFQMEIGDIVTSYDVRPVGETLERCQRYYQIVTGMTMRVSNAPNAQFTWRNNYNVVMRRAPIVSGYTVGSGTSWSFGAGSAAIEATAVADANGLAFATNILLNGEM